VANGLLTAAVYAACMKCLRVAATCGSTRLSTAAATTRDRRIK
jgi:hypothetical protein